MENISIVGNRLVKCINLIAFSLRLVYSNLIQNVRLTLLFWELEITQFDIAKLKTQHYQCFFTFQINVVGNDAGDPIFIILSDRMIK